jgi:cytosine/adenosine deaminase-related metal-dependent hydrolase
LNNHQERQLLFGGARCAIGPHESIHACLQITGDRITRVLASPVPGGVSDWNNIDLSGYLILPGLVNAHDHLEFSIFPRLAHPPYRNYIDWGDDIHSRFPEVIARHRAVPKDIRLWWGGIRNLLCGVTTVSHHNPLWPELQRPDFPVRVVRRYGWGHSLALGGDIRQARGLTRVDSPFILHACEGVDNQAQEELWELERLGLLDENTVLVHGLAIDHKGVALVRDRRASLIVCPSSNNFLFQQIPDLATLGGIQKVALGSDSPLTAEGDLLDEVRFARRFCGIPSAAAYEMVTTIPAAILRLENAEGSIRESGIGDLIAIRDTGQEPAERLEGLSMNDVELVVTGGQVRLATETIYERLPLVERRGMEALSVDGSIRWLRAPVKMLLQKTEEVLGEGRVRLGSRTVKLPARAEIEHAC